MKLLLIVGLLLVISCGKNPSLNGPLNSGGSSVPDKTLPITAELEKAGDINILVFPHTLSSDGAHGKPDNKKRATLESKSKFTLKFLGKELLVSKVVFTLKGSNLAFSANGSDYVVKSVDITQNSPIKIIRENATDKSHLYDGKLKVMAHSASEIRVINTIDLETYLRGVVPSESPASWHIEALKAQTLAARSYAYYHLKTAPKSRAYHVDDTARFQVYTGLTNRHSNTDQAIKDTAREVITHDGGVIVAYFHSYSGGFLEEAHTIFGGKVAPYTKKTQEIFSNEELRAKIPSGSQWIIDWGPKKFTKESILKKLKASSRTKNKFKSFTEADYSVEISKVDLRNDTGLSFKFSQGKKEALVGRFSFRSVIGWSNVLSYQFRIEEDSDDILLSGHGWGHHVGMSQYGAFMMATHYDRDYQEILNHYYRDIKILKYEK